MKTIRESLCDVDTHQLLYALKLQEEIGLMLTQKYRYTIANLISKPEIEDLIKLVFEPIWYMVNPIEPSECFEQIQYRQYYFMKFWLKDYKTFMYDRSGHKAYMVGILILLPEKGEREGLFHYTSPVKEKAADVSICATYHKTAEPDSKSIFTIHEVNMLGVLQFLWNPEDPMDIIRHLEKVKFLQQS